MVPFHIGTDILHNGTILLYPIAHIEGQHNHKVHTVNYITLFINRPSPSFPYVGRDMGFDV